jgi:hypothetical protein
MLWRRKTRFACAAAAGGAFALSLTGSALAQQTVPQCSTLNLPHPVWGAGGSAITADLALVAAKLAGLQNPITILYSDPSACTGLKGFVDKAVKGNFWYWTAAGEQKSCAPDQVTGQEVDFAHLGNPAIDCTNTTLPADAKDFPAPVQTLNVIVGVNSQEQSISAEALYFIYGFGSAGQAAPWTNNAHIVKRTPTSFVHLFLASAIGVPPASFKGDVQVTTNPDSIAKVVEFSATSQNTAIGYVSGSAADKARATVKTLAFQAKDQTCAYWPDSGPTKNDKANVLNGQYALWTPGHWFARVNSSGAIINPDVKNLIDWYDAKAEPPTGVDVIGLAIDSGDIPRCAMKVTRAGLTGAISSFAPENPCTHYFEKRATGETDGKVCTNDDACGSVSSTSKCRFGYCEAY